MNNLLTFEKFLFSLKEGLILTHNLDTTIHLMNIDISKVVGYTDDFKIKKLDDKTSFRIILFSCKNEINFEEKLKFIIQLCNNFGYFPSYYYLTLNTNQQIKDKYNLNQILSFDNIIELDIIFESKFGNELEIPNIMYHLTKKKYIEKIFKYGLSPKSHNKLSIHPDRIYINYNINDCYNLYKRFKSFDKQNNINDEYVILEINLNEPYYNDLKNGFRIYKDENSIGVYTYNNIRKNDIKDIEYLP